MKLPEISLGNTKLISVARLGVSVSIDSKTAEKPSRTLSASPERPTSFLGGKELFSRQTPLGDVRHCKLLNIESSDAFINFFIVGKDVRNFKCNCSAGAVGLANVQGLAVKLAITRSRPARTRQRHDDMADQERFTVS
mmetsp:Transcript_16881/g.29672  ORF Transcript_16881/g.29672 Transcript_16881/m.29672 type:complete len:138 (+) Transcript_16881:540-953(+)